MWAKSLTNYILLIVFFGCRFYIMEVTTSRPVLIRLLEAAGVTKDIELSKILGVSSQAVSKARQTNKIPPAWIPAIALKFGVSTDWLFFGKKEIDRAWENNHFKPSSMQENVEFVMIPKVAARLAAVSGNSENNGKILGLYSFRAEWICKKGDVSQMILMDVAGDSMLPEIKHGDMVLIDKGKTEILAYGYYAIGIEDAIYIKQLHTKPGQLILHSLNPDYEDIAVDLSQDYSDSISIIGRVLWIGRELD